MSRLYMHPLVLKQLIVLAELAQFRTKAAVLAAQRGKLTPQLWLQLPVGLKICLQSLHILLQPSRREEERAMIISNGSHWKTQQRQTSLLYLVPNYFITLWKVMTARVSKIVSTSILQWSVNYVKQKLKVQWNCCWMPANVKHEMHQ